MACWLIFNKKPSRQETGHFSKLLVMASQINPLCNKANSPFADRYRHTQQNAHTHPPHTRTHTLTLYLLGQQQSQPNQSVFRGISSRQPSLDSSDCSSKQRLRHTSKTSGFRFQNACIHRIQARLRKTYGAMKTQFGLRLTLGLNSCTEQLTALLTVLLCSQTKGDFCTRSLRCHYKASQIITPHESKHAQTGFQLYL